MKKRVSVRELKEYCSRNKPQQVLFCTENQEWYRGRPLQNQIILPNYVDMRKSQSDLPKVRDKYYVHRPDKICRNQ